MIPELGLFCLILALMMAFTQSCFPLMGLIHQRSAFLQKWSQPAAIGQCLFVTLSFITLMYCFAEDDFSIAYIAQNSHTTLPLGYKVCALWGAHEGSLLLWAFILSLWTFALSIYVKKLPAKVGVLVLAVMGAISSGFLLLLLCTSNPFERFLPLAPPEGSDLNPLLQDPGFVLHPPFLYMGYVGLAVPFAFAVSALLLQDKTLPWATWARPWALLAWALLTIGITLGSWWAYYELGWGGWWFWDPVENASFMPWLIGAALVHALYLFSDQQLFGSWCLLLALSAFILSLIGTFLVRSGVISSVHAFASDPARGAFILSFLGIVIVFSCMLYLWRGLNTKSDPQVKSLLSKEALILLGNMLLFVATLTVLLGTLYPIIVEVIAKERLSVGPPYFNSVFVPMMMPVLILMGIAPHLKRQRSINIKALLKVIGLFFIALCLHVLWLPKEFSAFALLGLLLGEWVVIVTLYLFLKMLISRQSISLLKMGMILAHLGIGISVLGICLTTSLEIEKDLRLAPHDSVIIQDFEFVFQEIKEIVGPNYAGVQATFLIKKDNSVLKTLLPEKRFFIPRNLPMSETAISPGFFRDFYIALGEPLQGDNWSVRIYIKPFIRLIWLGGLMIAAGALLASFLAFQKMRK